MAQKKGKSSKQQKKVSKSSIKNKAGKKKQSSAPKKEHPWWKIVLFTLIPVVFIFLVIEGVVRATGLGEARIQTKPLPEEKAGLFQPDSDLFWSLRPNLNLQMDGAVIKTNDIGLRSGPISPKKDNEYRILSLGESSTFGVGVENNQTYTALLENILRQRDPSRPYTAINAGVSAWSSFQSLKFLESRGLDLKPDLVLFYHEVNDYLPSSLRDSSNNELGIQKTDKELYESRLLGFSRFLEKYSAFFRFLKSKMAFQAIKKFDRQNFNNPLMEIGMPDIGISARLNEVKEGEAQPANLNEKSLGRRVSEVEREENLNELVEICKANNIELVIIHPAYRVTTNHQCLLTRFCSQNGVRMYEALNDLRPAGINHRDLYRDTFHPNVEGHRRLGNGLGNYLSNLIIK